jgi:hypothetical protein
MNKLKAVGLIVMAIALFFVTLKIAFGATVAYVMAIAISATVLIVTTAVFIHYVFFTALSLWDGDLENVLWSEPDYWRRLFS